MKYFIQKSTGLTIGVPEDTKVGEGKHALSVLEQYELYPEYYTPCDKNGKPLKAVDDESKDENTVGKKSKSESKDENTE